MTTVYAAMEDELLVIEGENDDWRADSKLTGEHPQCLALDPERPERLYCGTFGQGLYKSEDGGTSWRMVGEGIIHAEIMAVAVAHDGTVYAGTEPSAVFRSGDGGESWQSLPGLTDLPSASQWSFPPKPYTHHVRWIEADPNDTYRLYVCIEAGALVYSPDGGESWEDRHPDGPRDTHTLATHPRAPGRLYSAAGDGYFESPDAGESWRSPVEGLSHRYLWGLAVDPYDPETRVVSASRGPMQAHSPRGAESVIYRRGAGASWQMCRAGLPGPEGTLSPVLAAAGRAAEFWALTNRGLYRSRDAGESWDDLGIVWPERYRSQHPQALMVSG